MADADANSTIAAGLNQKTLEEPNRSTTDSLICR
jgi:hypothetical protein